MYDTRDVIHQFTEDELIALRETFAEKQIQLEEKKEEAAEIAAGFKKEIKDMQTEVKDFRMKIKNKQETRTIEVESRPNYARQLMEFFDRRTGELVDARRLTPAERQLSIEGDETVISIRTGTNN